jgi:hypothetical protein
VALHSLVGSSCLVKDKEHGDLRGLIRGIAVECVVENLEQSVDLTIFVVDLGFGTFANLQDQNCRSIKKADHPEQPAKVIIVRRGGQS